MKQELQTKNDYKPEGQENPWYQFKVSARAEKETKVFACNSPQILDA